MTHPKIQANTRYAFACIAVMLAAFLVFALVMVAPLGLGAANQMTVMRVSLYTLLVFAVLGGIFSIRVAVLRKNSAKVVK